MGNYRRPRIVFICEESVKKELEELAEVEHRSLSNYVEMLVVAVLQKNKKISRDKGEDTETSVDAGADARSFLKKLGSGKRPNSIERASLADSLEIDVEILDRLVDCIFEEKREVNHGG